MHLAASAVDQRFSARGFLGLEPRGPPTRRASPAWDPPIANHPIPSSLCRSLPEPKIPSRKFGPLTLGPPVGTSGDVSSGPNTFGDIVLAMVGIPPINLLTSGA